MNRGEMLGVVAVSVGLAVAGLSSAWPSRRERGQVTRPPAGGAVDEAPPPAAPPQRPLETALAAAPAPSLPREASLMARLRDANDTNPALAVQLAREGNRLFPDSGDAPERASILIHALARQGRASEAREEAEDMVNRYPDSERVREVERFTGAHRRRNLRLSESGAIESY